MKDFTWGGAVKSMSSTTPPAWLFSEIAQSVQDIEPKFSGLCYILQQLRKFISNSEMGHVQASNIFHHFVWNDQGAIQITYLSWNLEDGLYCTGVNTVL